MKFFGFDAIEKHSNDQPAMRVFTDTNWEAGSEFILEARGQAPFAFRDIDALLLQGYYQNSEPLVKERQLILEMVQDPRLHFPMTRTGLTIKDLLEAESPMALQPTDVVMHIRLGDYRKANWVIDPAPQLAILRNIKPNRLIIVCQAPQTDAERNYLKFFEEFRPVMQHGTELEDFAVLRSANRIMVTNSTFSWAAAFLGNATERWIPEPTFNELRQISPTDHMYSAGTFDLSSLDIPSSLLAVTGEFLMSFCDYIVLNRAKNEEIGPWIDAVVPPARQLYVEDEWDVKNVRSLFVYPESGLLRHTLSKDWPDLRLIVSHNGDNCPDYEVLIPFLDAHPNVYAWLQNNMVVHPQIRTLPIAEQNRLWRGGRYDWEPSVSICRAAERSHNFLYSFCWPTAPIRRVWFKEAQGLRTSLPTLDFYPHRVPREDYIEMLTQARAVICPPGNGIDTHRHWETLYNGAWAAVQDNPHTHCLMREYPSLPLIPIASPAAIPAPPTELPSPFHPLLLRPFWRTLFDSYCCVPGCTKSGN